jgi:hypothetical protein
LFTNDTPLYNLGAAKISEAEAEKLLTNGPSHSIFLSLSNKTSFFLPADLI